MPEPIHDDRRPPRDVALRLERHTGVAMEHEATVNVPVDETGENWEVVVQVLRQADDGRRWYAWRMPQAGRSVLCAVPDGPEVSSPQDAVLAGVSLVVLDDDGDEAKP